MNLKFQNKKYRISTRQEYSTLISRIDDSKEELQFIKLEDNEYMPLGSELSSDIYAAHDDKHIFVMVDGLQYVFDLLPDEDIFANNNELRDDKHQNISSPMPGSIVKILVNIGDNVEDGTPVIIIEAMKMETKLYSSINGKVDKINCSVGEQVDSDLALLEIVKE